MKHLLDIDVLSESGPPHEIYAEVRRREPVSWQEMPGVGGYWAVMRHADVVTVSRQPQIYSAQMRGMQLSDFTDQLPTLLSLDPPRHTEIRKRVLHSFAPRVVRRLESRIREVVRQTLSRAAEMGECDLVMDLARPLPLAIVCDLLGIPESDRERVGEWADLLAGAADPELTQGRDTGTSSALAFGSYAFELAQRVDSRSDASADSLLHVLRNAELAGARIRAGDRVVMMYASANRDEEVFDRAQHFDIGRDPNPHLAFGFGEHYCLGAALGRLEARIFLEEFFSAFSGIELAGEPARMRSNELNAWKRIPVALEPR